MYIIRIANEICIQIMPSVDRPLVSTSAHTCVRACVCALCVCVKICVTNHV